MGGVLPSAGIRNRNHVPNGPHLSVLTPSQMTLCVVLLRVCCVLRWARRDGMLELRNTAPPPPQQHANAVTATALNRKQYHRNQAALLIPLHSQQMSSSPQPPFPEQVSCPPPLSEQSIAQFMLDLPLLDEDRLSPELAACAAKLRSQFTHAASNAQTVLRAVRDAWIAWHSLPIISPGIAFC